MHIDTIRAACDALDREILQLCREFHSKFGLAVVGLQVKNVPDSRAGQYTARVAVQLEQI